MSAHTKGPWIVRERELYENDGHEGFFKIEGFVGNSDVQEYRVANVIDANDDPQNVANARLIAAAPALLEALIEAEEYFDDRADVVDGPYGEPQANKEMRVLETIRTALRAAGGEL